MVSSEDDWIMPWSDVYGNSNHIQYNRPKRGSLRQILLQLQLCIGPPPFFQESQYLYRSICVSLLLLFGVYHLTLPSHRHTVSF